MSVVLRKTVVVFAALLVILSTPVAYAQLFKARVAADEINYLDTKLSVTGKIVDERGLPIANAVIRLFAWGENAGNYGRTARTNARGRYYFTKLDRRAALFRITRNGYYTEIMPVDLQRPLTQSRYFAGKVTLYNKRQGRARLIFAGDTMMGRRFFDRDEDGDWGEQDDLIRRNSVVADSKSLFKFVRQSLTSDDHTVINLETPITNDPFTPHPNKTYTFYTRPESVDGLSRVGVDAVSLGNNHVYDYLEDGMTSTLRALDATSLRWFGGGASEREAIASRKRIWLNGMRFSFQGFSQLTEAQHGDPSLEIVAHDTPVQKGGALALTNESLQTFVRGETGNRFVVPVVHGGSEYASTQTNSMKSYFKYAIQQGADMVVGHHPHVPHGISTYNAGKGPRWIFGSLGNFVFDQSVYETFRSYLAMVDVQHTKAGMRVKRVQLLPYRIDNYTPRFLVGDGLTKMARTLGHLSMMEGTRNNGIAGATVFEQKGRVYAAASPYYFKITSKTTNATIVAGPDSSSVFEFTPEKPSDFLSGISASRTVTCSVGRDSGVLGSFEEQDVDDAYSEGDVWQQTESRFVQNTESYRGRGAMVLLRKGTDSSRASTWLGNKLRVNAGDQLSLTGFNKANNAGEFVVDVRWMKGSATLSQQVEYTAAADTHDWRRFTIDLIVPDGADGVKIYYRLYPPANGEGMLFLDNLSLIHWENEQRVTSTTTSIKSPNDWRFIRCKDVNEGAVDLTLSRSIYSLK